MISAERIVSPELITRFINRNRPAALTFNGTSDSQTVNWQPSGDFSIALRVKRTATQDANDRLVDWSDSGPSGGFALVFPTGGVDLVQFNVRNGATSEAGINSSALTQDVWYSVCATYTVNSAILYLDGTSQGSDTSVTMTIPTQTVTIGKRSAAATNFFTGQVDDLMTFNRVLTPTEVSNLALNRTVPGGVVIHITSDKQSSDDRWRSFLQHQGGGGGSLSNREKQWLRVKGGTGESLTELWATYLSSKGFNTGSLEDRMRAFFTSGTQT